MTREALGLLLSVLGLAIISFAVLARLRRQRAAPPSSGAARRSLHVAPSAPRAPLAPPPGPPPTGWARTDELPAAHDVDEHDMTLVTLRSHVAKATPRPAEEEEDDDGVAAATLAHPILFDEDAAVDEPTGPMAYFLLSAAAQTDAGKVRRRNEDTFLQRDDEGLYVVADGMGGYAGGEVASELATRTVEGSFARRAFGEPHWPGLPRRAWELAGAIEAANAAVRERSRAEPRLSGMGTTIVAARFSPHKQRLYVGHVGDSRCYRLRAGRLVAMTEDHTLSKVGVTGPAGGRLMRAIGVEKHVEIDLVVAKPLPGDTYLLCTDGLTKMVSEEDIARLAAEGGDLTATAQRLVQAAIDRGGKDNVTVLLVRVVQNPGAPPASARR